MGFIAHIYSFCCWLFFVGEEVVVHGDHLVGLAVFGSCFYAISYLLEEFLFSLFLLCWRGVRQ